MGVLIPTGRGTIALISAKNGDGLVRRAKDSVRHARDLYQVLPRSMRRFESGRGDFGFMRGEVVGGASASGLILARRSVSHLTVRAKGLIGAGNWKHLFRNLSEPRLCAFVSPGKRDSCGTGAVAHRCDGTGNRWRFHSA
jgi:hypothetical protein